MKWTWVAALLIASLSFCAFGWWGMATEAGQRSYDEMDGLYPLGALIAAGSLAVLAVLVALLRPPGR